MNTHETLNLSRDIPDEKVGEVLFKVISLDIETANLDMKVEGLSFDDPKGWKTSCVCVHDSITNLTHTYVHADMVNIVKENCEGVASLVYDFRFLGHHLRGWRDDGFLLLTHNGLGFDLPIISKTVKDGGVGRIASLLTKWPKGQMMDTCAVLTKATGQRYRLNHLIHGMLGEDESKLMDAANAPKEWAKGNYADVIRYCIDDTRKTLAVFYEGFRQKEFRAIGKDEYRIVPIEEFVSVWEH